MATGILTFIRQVLPIEVEHAKFDLVATVKERLRDEMGAALLRSRDDGRPYVVRVPPIWENPSTDPAYPFAEYRLMALVALLDYMDAEVGEHVYMSDADAALLGHVKTLVIHVGSEERTFDLVRFRGSGDLMRFTYWVRTS